MPRRGGFGRPERTSPRESRPWLAEDSADADDDDVADLPVSLRASGCALIVSGLLVAAVTPWHPDILDRSVARVVRAEPSWAFIHVATVVAVVLSLYGAVGLVAAHRGRLGRLGRVALVVEAAGVVMTASLAMTEALVFPAAATRVPSRIAVGGPVLASSLFVGAGILALGWPLGMSLLGLASARAAHHGKVPGVLLAISGPLFLALAGPFVPVAGTVAAVLFGGVQAWWGVLVVRSAVPA